MTNHNFRLLTPIEVDNRDGDAVYLSDEDTLRPISKHFSKPAGVFVGRNFGGVDGIAQSFWIVSPAQQHFGILLEHVAKEEVHDQRKIARTELLALARI